MAESTNSAAVTGDRRESVAVTESVRASEAVSRPSKPGKSFEVLGESTRPYMVHAPSAGPHSDGHAPRMMPSVRNSTYTNANQGAPFCNPAYGMRPAAASNTLFKTDPLMKEATKIRQWGAKYRHTGWGGQNVNGKITELPPVGVMGPCFTPRTLVGSVGMQAPCHGTIVDDTPRLTRDGKVVNDGFAESFLKNDNDPVHGFHKKLEHGGHGTNHDINWMVGKMGQLNWGERQEIKLATEFMSRRSSLSKTVRESSESALGPDGSMCTDVFTEALFRYSATFADTNGWFKRRREQNDDWIRNRFSFTSPPVIIGCWQLLERHYHTQEALRVLKEYYDAGFHCYDTADLYGMSESILGQLKTYADEKDPENDMEIYTKFITSDPKMEGARYINNQSRARLCYKAVHKSGGRYGATNGRPLDLVQLHWWDFADAGFYEAADNLAWLQRKDQTVNYIGVTNFDCKHLIALMSPPSSVPVVSNQVEYSMLDRRVENGMMELCGKNSIRLICYGVVAGGWLSDKFIGYLSLDAALTRNPKLKSVTTSMSKFKKEQLDRWCDGDWELYQELLRVLRLVADRKQAEARATFGGEGDFQNVRVSIANVAALWVLHMINTHGSGGSVIIGIRDTGYLEENKVLQKLVGEGIELDDVDLEEIEWCLAKGNRNRQEDIWHRERGIKDRDMINTFNHCHEKTSFAQ